MKKLFLSVLCAAALSIPASAMALPSQVPFAAFITDGPVQIPVGTWFFDLDADVAGTVCRYYVEWDNNAIMPLSTDCFVDEAKVHGTAGCLGNRASGITSVLTLDMHFGCSGFDRFNQFQPKVGMLILGEVVGTGAMTGLIQFTPGFTMVSGLQLVS